MNGYGKYHIAEKTQRMLDGILFDSKKERFRYQELKLLEKAGEITKLVLQPSFILQESFIVKGKHYRAISYIADFRYLDTRGNIIIEDCKGMKTDVYLLKKKLLLNKYREIDFSEI